MSIFLSYTTTIEFIQKRFSEYFPYLKIDVYSKSFITPEGILQNARLPKSTRLINHVGERPLQIASRDTPMQLESIFENYFDARIKVFRKTEKGWLDISIDDNFTLFRHNQLGRDASNAIFDFELL